jgi:hypothetical protein
MVTMAHGLASLTLAFCLLLGATRVIGDLLPAPPNQSILASSPCALPCFFDVTPGVTTHLQAIERLTRYGTVNQMTNRRLRLQLVDHYGNRAYVWVNSNAAGGVQSVRVEPVNWTADIARLSELMMAGYRPAHIIRTCAKQTRQRLLITLGVHDELEVGVLTENALSPDTGIMLLDIATAPWRVSDTNAFSFPCAVRMDWTGFALLWNYQTTS